MKAAFTNADTLPGEEEGSLRELKLLAEDIEKRRIRPDQWKMVKHKIDMAMAHLVVIHNRNKSPSVLMKQKIQRMVKAGEDLQSFIENQEKEKAVKPKNRMIQGSNNRNVLKRQNTRI
ncbi:MAG: hypothetical protein O2779_02990 [Nanoarchaeota archaeon]|nr:hypothetical protein [Nanoarchaeota archaeon]